MKVKWNDLEPFWIVFGTSKDIFQIFCAQTSKQFLWKPFTSTNFKRLYSAYKGSYRVIFSIKNFQKFHLKWKLSGTIWNHSGSFLELLKTVFKFFAPKIQSNSFENPLRAQTLNASTALINGSTESLFRSKFFKNFIWNESEVERFGTILDSFWNF